MKKLLLSHLLCLTVLISNCQKPSVRDNTGLIGLSGDTAVAVSTDRACYEPGEQVVFTIDRPLPPGTRVTYTALDQVVGGEMLSGTRWTWTAPARDFTGYLATLSRMDGTTKKIYATIAVDVSSDAAHFPRNGFLSYYGETSAAERQGVIDRLNRLHINWLQFQDWEWKHHRPLAGTPQAPAATWRDIAGRLNYRQTVAGYIDLAHDRHIKTLSYNLCYGALNDAASDGVSASWYLYTDPNHTTRDVFNLPSPPFKSDIYFTNPANKGWQDYLASRNKEFYQVYDFDGYQIDQVGNRNKTLYDYEGNTVDLQATFPAFIRAMKKAQPEKSLVMNAVNQYGQPGMATSPVAFLYSEVWAPHEGFKDLAQIIGDNDRYGAGDKRTVLAAYMDYDLADGKGIFNTPGVLLTDAVIFAFGGAHLELGEHMLGKEYFPNDNLAMGDDLRRAMVRYYDFLVAYENLLRDGGSFNTPALVASDAMPVLNNWPPVAGQVSVVGKDLDSCQVIHLINFTRANSLDWRDRKGTQPEPAVFSSVKLRLTSTRKVDKLWFASPDVDFGAPQALSFEQAGDQVTFMLPSLQYWDMIVVAYPKD